MQVDTMDVLRRYWYPVAFAENVGTAAVARELLGEQLVIWQPGPDQVAVAIDRCPHRDARLSGGEVCDGAVVCPYHGWEYGADGRAVTIPQLAADAPHPPRARLEMVHSKLDQGVVWACLDEPSTGVPELPRGDAEGRRILHQFDEVWETDAVRLIENSFDPAHTVFVHSASFGDQQNPAVDVPEVERTAYGLVMSNDLSVTNVSGRASSGVDAETTNRTMVTHYHAPFLRVLDITYPNGRAHSIVTAATPIAEGRMRLVQWCVRNDTEADSPAAEVIAFDRQVTNEDRELLEGMWAPYSLDVTASVHLKVDRAVVEIRRQLAELIAGAWTPEHGAMGSEPPAPPVTSGQNWRDKMTRTASA